MGNTLFFCPPNTKTCTLLLSYFVVNYCIAVAVEIEKINDATVLCLQLVNLYLKKCTFTTIAV